MKEPNYDPRKAEETVASSPAPVMPGRPEGGYRVPREEDKGGQGEQFDPRRILGIMLSYWWLILLIVLVGTGGGVAYCFLASPKYRAVCQYEIFSEKKHVQVIEALNGR